MIDLLRAQLLATRAQIDAMLAVIDSVPSSTESPAARERCPHPETVNIGTFGAPVLRCEMCHQIVEAQG